MTFWWPFCFFSNLRPPYWIEVINIERWNAIPLPTLSQATCIPNLKIIKAKLRAWQCRLTFYKMAAMTSPNHANYLKLKSDHLHVCRTHCVKFQANRSSSFVTRVVTDRQTHTHRHTHIHQAPFSFPETITIHSVLWKRLNVKKGKACGLPWFYKEILFLKNRTT